MNRALVFSAAILTSPALAEPSPMAHDLRAETGITRSAAGGSLASIASRYVGLSGPQIGLPARLWCGDFLNMVRRKAGLRAPVSRRAFDQAQFAQRIGAARPGAIMIYGRGRGGGHAALIVETHGDGTVTTIEGNVSRRVVKRRVAVRGLIVQPI